MLALAAFATLRRAPSSHQHRINQETPGSPGVSLCGRYWDRTSDLFRVREARYRCANRPSLNAKLRIEVDTGFEPVYTALQAAASPLGQSTERHNTEKPVPYLRGPIRRPGRLERMTRLELATLTLAR